MDDEMPQRKKSKIRMEIESLLETKGIIQENKIFVANLESGEIQYFENYFDALEFIKGKTGRWYIAASGSRYSGKDR